MIVFIISGIMTIRKSNKNNGVEHYKKKSYMGFSDKVIY